MNAGIDAQAISEYWDRDDLERDILNALKAAGKDLEELSIDDLAPFDQFHGGGKGTTVRLARLAGLAPGMRVLDVGGGLGGPARTLAVEFGCLVTVLDLAESYLKAGEALTRRLGLGHRVTYQLGDALAPPSDESFDVLWTQHSGMNIDAKEHLYAGFFELVKPRGLLALQEPMAGPVQPLRFPVMWANNAEFSFLRTQPETQTALEAAGFRLRTWQDITRETTAPPGRVSESSIQYLIMREKLDAIQNNGRRNQEEGRVQIVQAVFDRP
jgi:ubiquinone/menaquinone biosynthesis C-methylase UbiE